MSPIKFDRIFNDLKSFFHPNKQREGVHMKNLKEIANIIRNGYSEGDGWKLLIEINVWENLKDSELEEIATHIENGETGGYDPCGWDLVI